MDIINIVDIESLIYVGRESLEMMFLTLMVVTAIVIDKKILASAMLGLLCGLLGGFALGELLHDYEVLMYALLSGLMLYLFFTSANLPVHIKGHVDAIANRNKTNMVGYLVIWFIYFRESMEVFTFMFQRYNNTWEGWTGAGLAVIIVAGLYKWLVQYKDTKALFTITRYAFLAFAIWFGYEALEHACIHACDLALHKGGG
jgi:hypothetical protein